MWHSVTFKMSQFYIFEFCDNPRFLSHSSNFFSVFLAKPKMWLRIRQPQVPWLKEWPLTVRFPNIGSTKQSNTHTWNQLGLGFFGFWTLWVWDQLGFGFFGFWTLWVWDKLSFGHVGFWTLWVLDTLGWGHFGLGTSRFLDQLGFGPVGFGTIWVCDHLGLWPFGFVTNWVCDRLGLWPFGRAPAWMHWQGRLGARRLGL